MTSFCKKELSVAREPYKSRYWHHIFDTLNKKVQHQMQEIRLNQKTKNIPLYPKDTNTLKVLAPFVTLPLSPLLCVLWWWRSSRARWSTAPTTRNAGLGSRRWLLWLCLDYMMLGITRISRYESIELQKNIVIDSNLKLSFSIKLFKFSWKFLESKWWDCKDCENIILTARTVYKQPVFLLTQNNCWTLRS